MKKVIIVNNNLETGGVQISLMNLLMEIKDKYDVTLLLFYAKPEQLASVPEGVKVIIVKSPFKHFGSFARDARKNPFMFTARAIWKVLAKAFGQAFVVKLMLPFQKKYKGYDYAVSYLHECAQDGIYGGCNEFVLKKIEADKKIGWLHCDFSLNGGNNKQSKRIYGEFDQIVACSEGCRKVFVECLPQFADKTISIRNCNDYERIKNLAGDGIRYDKEYFNIVTVARLSEEKGIERAIEAVHECVKHGLKVKYHIVGSGIEEGFLKGKADELGLNETVVFYGNKQNPYPYIKNADLFLLTSYHEAAPMVFDEAACLGVPVLATETTSTDDMIKECNHGFVCKNRQNDITEKLLEIVSQPERLREIRDKLAEETFDNRESVNKIQKIIV